MLQRKRLTATENGHVQAHGAIHRALKNGVIFRKNICASCFKENQITHFHHLNGYAKSNWLDVVELCAECHKEAHLDIDHEWHPRASDAHI